MSTVSRDDAAPVGLPGQRTPRTRDRSGEPEDWVTALSTPGPDQDDAMRRLHALMVRAAAHQVWRLRAALPDPSPGAVDDLANHAADDAMTALLGKLHTFEGRSRFRTWLYRIVVNHVLNARRGRAEPATVGFGCYAHGLDTTPDLDLPDPRTAPADLRLLVDEARISCTSGMLLCLDREQRLVYILGEILAVTDTVGAELLEVAPETFLGYRRPTGRVGTRNYLGIVSSVNCSATVSKQIAARMEPLLADFPGVDGVMPLTHKGGCGTGLAGHPGFDVLRRTLKGYGEHPNFAGFLVIGLGCEVNQTVPLIERQRLQRPTVLSIQESGGVRRTIEAGVRAVEQLLPACGVERLAQDAQRVPQRAGVTGTRGRHLQRAHEAVLVAPSQCVPR